MSLYSIIEDLKERLDRMESHQKFIKRSDQVKFLQDLISDLDEIESSIHDECYSEDYLQDHVQDMTQELRDQIYDLKEELEEFRSQRPIGEYGKPRLVHSRAE